MSLEISIVKSLVQLLFFHEFSGGSSIIFTETKDQASELAGLLPGARPLHGDIQQSQREVGCQFSDQTLFIGIHS